MLNWKAPAWGEQPDRRRSSVGDQAPVIVINTSALPESKSLAYIDHDFY